LLFSRGELEHALDLRRGLFLLGQRLLISAVAPAALGDIRR
jgi:hypothetical protein